MNLFSLFSIILSVSLFIGGTYCLTRKRKSTLNVFSFLVLFTLSWWNFCSALFFDADNLASAWFWHRLGALGWTGFVALTAFYFFVLTGNSNLVKGVARKIAFFAFPSLLMFRNLVGQPTSFAEKLVRSSTEGLWTFVNSSGNILLWLYLLVVIAYFGLSFSLLLRWAENVKHSLKKKMAVLFVIIDALTILLGFITDVMLPLLGIHSIPAMANLSTAIFGAGYFLLIVRYDLFNFRNVVDDRRVIENCVEGVLVTDENGEILDANSACARLLDLNFDMIVGRYINDCFPDGEYKKKIQSALDRADYVSGEELSILHSRAKKRVMISGSVIRDRKNEYLGTVISLLDITQLSMLREKYRIQSDEYQRLAYIDTLTGLPNRRKTFETLIGFEKEYSSGGLDFYILYMDINNFKSVNDRFGHNVGDRFLCEVSARLKSRLVSETEFLGRLSGDEFLISGRSACPETDASACVIRIKKAFEADYCIDGSVIKSGISVGIAKYSDYGDIDTAVTAADEKMYKEKQSDGYRNKM